MKKKIKKVLLEHRTTHINAPWLWLPASDHWIEKLADEIESEIKK